MSSLEAARARSIGGVIKFMPHGGEPLRAAIRYGWYPGARYDNLRNVRGIEQLGFLDIVWHGYSFRRHLSVVKSTRPLLTVACDIVHSSDVSRVLDEAAALAEYAERVIIVPKAVDLAPDMEAVIPPEYVFGFSVPTTYGGTRIPPRFFKREVHLLGGHPATQRGLADVMQVHSLDCNRLALDASFGKFFDGRRFRLHPYATKGTEFRKSIYLRCLCVSLKTINESWSNYSIGTLPHHGSVGEASKSEPRQTRRRGGRWSTRK